MLILHYIIYWLSFPCLYGRLYALCHDICVSLIFVSSIFALFFMVFLLRGDVSFFIVFFIKFSTSQKYKLIFINVFLNVSSTFLNVSSAFFYVSYKQKELIFRRFTWFKARFFC